MKNFHFLLVCCFVFQFTHSQEGVSFEENQQLYLRGNSILIGNNILGEHATNPLMDVTIPNDLVKMTYIDVDNDKATFSSSEATIIEAPKYSKIEYAALYWCGLYPFEKGSLRKSGNKMVHVGRGDRDEDVSSILFKTPNRNYEPINGEIIYDSYGTDDFKTNKPYVCYADVTKRLQSLPTINGTYTVGNIKATEGQISGGGSAGWLLYIVYEDPSQSPKYFTTYNGLVEVGKEEVEVDFKDFKSKEEGIVQTTIAIGAMEGDRKLKTDQVSVYDKKSGSYILLSNKVREEKNFFNSSITIGNDFFNNRNPNSTNTLGFDLLKMEIPNENNELFDHATTQANLKFQGKSDRFYLFFVAFETEIDNTFLEEKLLAVKEIIVTTPMVEVQDSLAIETSITEVAPIEKKSKTVDKSTTEVQKVDKKIVPKEPIILSEEDKIKKEVRIQSMAVPGLDPGYYLVTNVFSVPNNAVKWSQTLKDKNYSPGTFITPKDKWNYVYIASDKDLKPVYEKWKANNGLAFFKNIWIMKINL